MPWHETRPLGKHLLGGTLRVLRGTSNPLCARKVDIMWLLILLFVVVMPISSPAQYVGDLSPNPYHNNTIGNPFSPGSPLSPIAPRSSTGGRTSPTSPYTWSNVLPQGPPQPFYGAGQLQMSSPLNQNIVSPLNQNQTSTGSGPYGITLPPGHPLGNR